MLAVSVLGPFEVRVDGQVAEVPGLRTRAVIARLALDARRVVSIDALLDEVWGSETPANPLNAVQARVSQIRSVIGPARLLAARPGYVLDVDPDDVDALVAERRVHDARRLVAAGAPEAGTALDGALALWRGPVFGGLGDAPFTEGARARWTELQLGALEDRLRLDVDHGRPADALPQLESLTAAQPFHEPLHELLMRAYALLDRQADALAAYRRIRARLAEELGIDPGRRLQALELAVLQQSDTGLPGAVTSARPNAPVPEVAVRDDRAPIRTPARGGAGNVARPLGSIVHRHDDLAALRALVAERGLVTVTGTAGVGKTRLALELAATDETHADGVWFVALDALTHDDDVAVALASTLGLPADAGLAGVTARLASADALVVLDNCEHLAHGPADAARAIRQACPGVAVLLTSQRSTGLAGETVWPLRPLTSDDALELFLSRVQEQNARFEVDDATRSSARQVCDALEGLPLAIELAARRCTVFSVQELAERLSRPLAVLGDRARPGSSRHHSLRDAISWSYELLFPDAQLTLQVLAVFADGARADAVEVVGAACGLPADDVIEYVSQLVDRSLVVVDPRPGGTRYRLLDSIRQFALERADDAQRSRQLRAAHADWVSSFGRACVRGLRTHEQARWLARVRDERGNVDTGFEWLVRHRPTDALVLAANLFLGWLIVGEGGVGARRLRRALDTATDAPALLRPLAQACEAVLLARSGRADDALPLASDALDAMIRAGDAQPALVAHVRSMLGQVLTYAGRIDEGIAQMREARTALGAVGDVWAEAICTFNMAHAAGLANDDARQEALTLESLTLRGDLHDPFTDQLAHRNLGLVQARRGALAEARASFERALVAERAIGFVAEEAATLRELAGVLVDLGELDEARAALADAVTASRRIGDVAGVELVRRRLDELA